MNSSFPHSVLAFVLCLSSTTWGQVAISQNSSKDGKGFSDNGQTLTKVPKGVILVKGAWSSSSDSVTPVPEHGSVSNSTFRNAYFGITYQLPPTWTQEYEGPPPSDSGSYVLAEIEPPYIKKMPLPGSILITAQDMFFAPMPATNALELVDYMKDHLQADYRLEIPPKQTEVAGRPFTFFGYWSPVADLHWYVLATQIRCHAVEFVLTSRSTKLLDNLISDMDEMRLPEEASPTGGTGGGAVPLCIKDYARDENVIARVDPVFTDHKFNSVPVRIIIDKDGKVTHIHFLSAFPDQVKAISDALGEWRFKPYLKDGKPTEVETGILFGRAPRMATPRTIGASMK
jgi:hypothetical protein